MRMHGGITCKKCQNTIRLIESWTPGFIDTEYYIVTCNKCGEEYFESSRDNLFVEEGGTRRWISTLEAKAWEAGEQEEKDCYVCGKKITHYEVFTLTSKYGTIDNNNNNNNITYNLCFDCSSHFLQTTQEPHIPKINFRGGD